MKETKKREITMEQKVYMALLGTGIVALVGLTVLYGVKSQKTGDVVEQNIELGEENPVSGQVAQAEQVDEPVIEMDDPNAQAVESISQEKVQAVTEGYNGTDELEWPVDGNILIPYSMDTTVYFETLDQYQCNPAIFIKADVGTEVKAVFGGTVTKVEESDRYGQLITVDMGNGFETVYGQLSDISYKKGDQIKTGATIGKIAEPTNYFLLEGAHLYMKMTKDKEAVNPTDYFTT